MGHLAKIAWLALPMLAGCSALTQMTGQVASKADPKAVVRVDKIHATFNFDIGGELRKAGMTSAVGFMPAFESTPTQDVTYAATIDGKKIPIVKDIRGRDVFMIECNTSSKAKIEATFEVPVFDKSGAYKAPTQEVLTEREKTLALRSDDRWFNFKDPQFKAGLEKRGLIRKPNESEYDFVCRFQDYLRANSRYSLTNVNHRTSVDAAFNFQGGDCKDYTFFGLNVLRFNGIPAMGEIQFPLHSDGANSWHAAIRFFSKDRGWCQADFSDNVKENRSALETVARSFPRFTNGNTTIIITGYDIHYRAKHSGTEYSLGGFMHGFDCFSTDGKEAIVIPTITHDFRGSGK